MISSTLRPRVRALTTILGLDLLRCEPDLRWQTAAAPPTTRICASAAAPVTLAGGVR